MSSAVKTGAGVVIDVHVSKMIQDVSSAVRTGAGVVFDVHVSNKIQDIFSRVDWCWHNI
jgi:hypothetical protein